MNTLFYLLLCFAEGVFWGFLRWASSDPVGFYFIYFICPLLFIFLYFFLGGGGCMAYLTTFVCKLESCCFFL